MPGAELQVDDQTAARGPLLWVALAVVGGIVADRCGLANPLGGHLFWWVVSTLMIAACAVLQRRRAFFGAAYLLLLAIFSLAGAWHHLHWNYVDRDHLARFAREVSQPVCLEVVALDRTKYRPALPFNPLRALPAQERSEVEVQVTQLRDGTQWRTATGKCRLRVAGQLDGIATGDRLRVFAKFSRPRPALNPGQYNWAEAQRGAGRYCELFSGAPECVSVVQPAAFSSVGRWWDKIASQCQSQLAHYVGPEQSDLALAIMLGEQELLDQDTKESFFKTGTIHLLVVSGLHVGMLAAVVWLVVRSGTPSKFWAIAATTALVIAYATIVGGRPPVVRAAILIVLALIALLSMRRTSMKNLLAAAAIGVLAYNPSELFRSGTQLSFLCVAALAGYGSTLGKPKPLDPLTRMVRDCESWFRKVLRWAGSRFGQLAAASLIVWLVAAPLVAHHFHITTPVSILITPILWPLVAITLFSGLMICTLGWILPPVATLLGAISAISLSATRAVVVWAEQIEIGGVYLPGPEVWWLVVFYAALALFALSSLNRIGWKVKVSLAAVWIAVGLAAGEMGRQADQLRCTFLSVGHGTCVVLELPGRQTILYDAGSLGSPAGAADTIASYLWSRGITRIDAAVLSHADVDHYNAVPDLMQRFDLGVVYVSPLMFDPWATQGKLDAPEFLRSTLVEADIPLKEVWMNDRLLTANPEIQIDVLHPPQFGVGGSDNANSIILLVQYAGHTILLPGDLESPGIEVVMAETPLDCDILLAPHHGSSRSDPPGFAAWCTPDWVVVSGRHSGDDQQLTSASYRAVGAEVLHAADSGASTFTLDRQGITMSSFRKGNY
jgi:competence protein ComEC